MPCQRCAGAALTKAGRGRSGRQLYCCGTCGRRQTPHSAAAFGGYRCPNDIIAPVVRWHLRFRLPYRVMRTWWSFWPNAAFTSIRRASSTGSSDAPLSIKKRHARIATVLVPPGVGFQVSCAVVHYRCAHCPTTPAPLRPRVLLVSLTRPSHTCFSPLQDRRHSPPLPPIRTDRRKVRGTFCRIGAGFLGHSAPLARNSLPFHTCRWRTSPGILQRRPHGPLWSGHASMILRGEARSHPCPARGR